MNTKFQITVTTAVGVEAIIQEVHAETSTGPAVFSVKLGGKYCIRMPL